VCALPCQDRPCAAHVMANTALVILCLALAGAAACNAAASASRLVMKPLDLRAARGQADGLPRDVHGAPEQFSGYFQVRRGSACPAICMWRPDRSLVLQHAEACMPVVLAAGCSSAPSHEAYTDNLLASCALAADPVCAAAAAVLRHAARPQINRTYAAEMFLMFFEARSANRSELPLVLWMTGGPGCSSELAIFYGRRPLPACALPASLPRALTRASGRTENGPFKITEDLELRDSEYGWDQAANIVFVDQPINTGFSYSADPRDRVYDETVVAADMLDFLHAFLERFPKYKGRKFFITGEVRERGGEAGCRQSAACARLRGHLHACPACGEQATLCTRQEAPARVRAAERGACAPPASVRHARCVRGPDDDSGGAELRGPLRARGQRRHPGPQPRPRRRRGHQPGRHRDRQRAHRPGQAVQPVRRLQRVQGPHRRDPARLHQHGAPAAAPQAASSACTAAAAAEAVRRAHSSSPSATSSSGRATRSTSARCATWPCWCASRPWSGRSRRARPTAAPAGSACVSSPARVCGRAQRARAATAGPAGRPRRACGRPASSVPLRCPVGTGGSTGAVTRAVLRRRPAATSTCTTCGRRAPGAPAQPPARPGRAQGPTRPPRARQECIGPLCYDFSRLDDYLAQPAVREALGVGARPWQSCSPDVYSDMSSARPPPCRSGPDPAGAGARLTRRAALTRAARRRHHEELPPAGRAAAGGGPAHHDLRRRGCVRAPAAPAPAAAREGRSRRTDGRRARAADDWICNWMGNRKWLTEMAWSNQTQFVAAPEHNWTVDGKLAGSVQAHGPLSFVKVTRPAACYIILGRTSGGRRRPRRLARV